MSDKLVARRSVLMGAGASALAVGAVVVPAASASAATSGPDDDGLTGAWLIERRDAGSPSSVQAVVTFSAGGALATGDANPPAPVNIGSWVVDGNHHFKAVFLIGQQAPDGTVISGRVSPEGSWSKDTIHGTYKVVVSAGGHTNTSHGSFHGRKLEP
jgi:hypothetical protein